MTKLSVAAVLLASLLPTMPASAAPVPLGETTVVASDHTAWAPVRVPKALSYEVTADGPRPSVKLTGGKRLLGFVLRAETTSAEAPGLEWVAPKSLSDLDFVSAMHYREDGDRLYVDLPAGDYRFYVITDGPASAELTLPGLDGHASAPATVGAPLAFEADTRRDSVPTTNAAIFGAAHDVGGPALLYTGITARTPVSTDPLIGTCIYTPSAPAPDDYGYAPGCPGSDEPTFIWLPGAPNVDIDTATWSTVWGNLDPGPWGLGAHSVSVGVPPELDWTAFWLDFAAAPADAFAPAHPVAPVPMTPAAVAPPAPAIVRVGLERGRGRSAIARVVLTAPAEVTVRLERLRAHHRPELVGAVVAAARERLVTVPLGRRLTAGRYRAVARIGGGRIARSAILRVRS